MAVITIALTPLDPIVVVVGVGSDWALINASVKVKYTLHNNCYECVYLTSLFLSIQILMSVALTLTGVVVLALTLLDHTRAVVEMGTHWPLMSAHVKVSLR